MISVREDPSVRGSRLARLARRRATSVVVASGSATTLPLGLGLALVRLDPPHHGARLRGRRHLPHHRPGIAEADREARLHGPTRPLLGREERRRLPLTRPVATAARPRRWPTSANCPSAGRSDYAAARLLGRSSRPRWSSIAVCARSRRAALPCRLRARSDCTVAASLGPTNPVNLLSGVRYLATAPVVTRRSTGGALLTRG